MNGSALPIHGVVITGGLGGLGSTLALKLREHHVAVTAVDVLHPGCAPFPVFAHRKQLLETAGTRVELVDMRRDDAAGRFLTGWDEDGDRLPPHWIHCAAPPPPDFPGTSPTAWHELSYAAPARWIEVATQRGWWYIVMQHFPAVLPGDARLLYPEWQALFDAESRLRQEYFPDALRRDSPGLFPFLPGLFGRLQSPHTPPLRQYLQLLAGHPVSVCAFDKPWSISRLESVACDLVQLLQDAAADRGAEIEIVPNPHPDLMARIEDWLILLQTLMRLDRVRLRSDQTPGNYYPTPAYADRLARLPEYRDTGFAVLVAEELRAVSAEDVAELLRQWESLPWMPPRDWPRALNRRGRRKE